MDCIHARTLLVPARRGRLEGAELADLRSHVSTCRECTRVDAAEGVLDELLDRQLPRRTAPAALVAELERMVGTPAGAGGAWRGPEGARWRRLLAPSLAAVLALLLAGVLLERASTRAEQARVAFLSEAVSDHLRALASERGPETPSGANHEVKPWFEGRVDFAPVVPVPDVPDLRLRGGSIGYFLDRRAAVISYTLRRHAMTLLAFRPEGLDLPEVPGGGGKVDLRTGGVRGFRVVAWRAGGVGYAMVSDVPPQELEAIATTFASATAGAR
jgi:anti-sigma factor RsiW